MGVLRDGIAQPGNQRLGCSQGRAVAQVHRVLKLYEILLQQLVAVLGVRAPRFGRRHRAIECSEP